MQRVGKSTGIWIITAFFTILTVLAIAPAAAHADGRTVTLSAPDGAVSQSSVVLDEGDLLPATMPTATKTGWNFVGWWSAPVTWQWWNDPKGLTGRLETPPAGFTNDPVDGHAYTFDSDYWTYLGQTTGKRVNTGDKVDGSTLYACFTPTVCHIDFNWNGWNNSWGALHVSRDYGTTLASSTPSAWGNHTFTGWYDNPNANQGAVYSDTATATRDLKLYAHYSGMAGDPNAQRDSMIAAFSVKVSPATVTITPNGGATTLSAALTMMSSTTLPSAKDWSNVHWTVTSGSQYVTLSNATGQSCTVTAANAGSGTATVQASFLNEAGRTQTATATITVKAHVHTWGAEQVVQKPTCQQAGYGYQYCTDKSCNEKLRVDHPKAAHTYKTDKKDATCETAGFERTYCTVCSYVESSRTIPAKGHSYGPVKTIQSCTGTVETKTCTVCAHTEQTAGTGTGSHTWQATPTVDKPATCGQAGSQSIHCAKCAVTKDSHEIPATGQHVWGGWHTTKPATTAAKGEQQRTCTTCGKTETQEIPALVGGVTTEPEQPADPEQPTDPEQPVDPEQPDDPQTPEPEDPDAGDAPEQTPQPGATEELYRLYNPETGAHCYTKNAAERDRLMTDGYTTETMKGATELPAVSSTPVYRLDNPYTGELHYTIDPNEYMTLQLAGWDGQGVAFYSADPTTGQRVYRLYNPYAEAQGMGAAAHHYTMDGDEIRMLMGRGYQLDENVAWYYLAA